MYNLKVNFLETWPSSVVFNNTESVAICNFALCQTFEKSNVQSYLPPIERTSIALHVQESYTEYVELHVCTKPSFKIEMWFHRKNNLEVQMNMY